MSGPLVVPQPVMLAAGHWPEPADDRVVGPPAVPGFVGSSFSPLVAVAAERCLRARYGEPPLPQPNRTAVVLVSAGGDLASARHVHQTVAQGKRLGPLYFFQSVPNSVAGHVAARWGLAGPVVCLNPTGEPEAEGLAQAALLLADGDADQVLVVRVEQQPEAEHAAALLVSGGDPS
jgi:3-oxoacyl-(acyl-carrier-protein) synthase